MTVPLLIEALSLLFNASLNPGGDVVTQLAHGLILRRGQAAVILRRLRTGEGLPAAAVSAAHR